MRRLWQGSLRMCSALVLLWAVHAPAMEEGVEPAGAAGDRMRSIVVRVGKTQQVLLELDHAGEAPLRITSVTSSCECVTVAQHPSEIAPGERGILDVRVQGNKPGEHDYQVTVQVEGAQEQGLVFILRTTVLPPACDHSLYVTPRQLLADTMAAGAHGVWVDVRTPAAYDAARIPGSLNMPAYAVKTKGFLRGQRVILVDEGWGSPALETECARMREMGFEAAILHGGLVAWRELQGPVEGSPPLWDELRPLDYLTVRDCEDWVVVDVRDGVENEPESSWMAGAVRIPFRAGEEDVLRAKVKDRVGARGEFAHVLVVDQEGGQYGLIRETLRGQVEAPVFYLAEGMRGLERDAALMAGIQQGGRLVTSASSGGSIAGASGGGGVREPCPGCP